ncbi:MAG: T9SS type A sorting domain-containing protein [Sporocytophaga sp.]|uniref:T9SS type A sorting domain-containing protein n=1 Tax=Sporocytophaga sp. TaxID=2231183 RepID=UPI001B2B1E31|nr:T9SS type A sorting domain-containing protein [Sporocytophaga sp.]MBO9700369.1 T9SS type A sorting domain-containing protein [Sporocytophaga sp.]
MKIQLFPNPSKESITIRIPEKESYFIQVFDGMGNKVRSFITDASEIQLDLRQFQSGAYFIEGVGGSKKFSQKFIIE